MAASYENAQTISRIAGADYSAAAPSGGQYRFAVINDAEVTDYTNPQNPGVWYGSSAGPPAIAPGNILVNTSAGGYCPFLIAGKALPGQPIEVVVFGRSVVIAGGTVTAGDPVYSDDAGAAVASGTSKLGTYLSDGVESDLVDILFNPGA